MSVIDPMEHPALADTLALLEQLDEVTIADAMSAARIAYMQGYEDAAAEREEVIA